MSRKMSRKTHVEVTTRARGYKFTFELQNNRGDTVAWSAWTESKDYMDTHNMEYWGIWEINLFDTVSTTVDGLEMKSDPVNWRGPYTREYFGY